MIKNSRGIILLNKEIINNNFFYDVNGKRHFIKIKTTNQAYIESIASYIYHILNNKSIVYKIGYLNNQLVTVSPDFKNKDIVVLMKAFYESISGVDGYQKVAVLASYGDLQAIKTIVTKFISKEVYEDFINMFISDMFILNEDRHENNYGIKTNFLGEICTIPAFDFDYSFGEASGIYEDNRVSLKDAYNGSDASVGLINNPRIYQDFYPYFDVIKYCLSEDYQLGMAKYQRIIEKHCDILKPRLFLNQYENDMQIELETKLKKIVIALSEMRKDAVWKYMKKESKSGNKFSNKVKKLV
ncbi:MAG: hypothetical protein RSC85_00350 [Bacilli bacterium]